MKDEEKFLRRNIGKKIKIARSTANYTQEELAEKLSLTPRYISQLERGIAFGSATTIIHICKELQIDSDFLFNDLIDNKQTALNNITDEKFLENYLKLDSYNKLIISVLANELVKIQCKHDNLIENNG